VKEKRIRVAGAQVVVRMSEAEAARLTRSWPYRLVRPALNRLAPSNGHRAAEIPTFYPRAVEVPEETPETQRLMREVSAHEGWYHTIDLGHGVRTPGEFDHGPALPLIPIPERLDGKRCLDVATLDGFWAFEMERRGATEVVALDIGSWTDLDVPPYVVEYFRRNDLERPTGAGFEHAARALGSNVRREICNVYDLTPERFGEFDLVFAGDLLVHIRNPLFALERICTVTRGEAIFLEPYAPELETLELDGLARLENTPYDSRWWRLSRSFLDRGLRLAGFSQVEECGQIDIRVRRGPETPIPRTIFRANRSA
jgi:tRNA (mo5U34)-methyltransferase